MATVISQVSGLEPKLIDREKKCPLLLRIFVKQNGHNHPSEFNRGGTPGSELQIYTWEDCTLKELSTLIKDVNPESRRKNTEFHFSTVFPNRSISKYNIKNIGILRVGTRGVDDSKTLKEVGFEVGDFIDVAIYGPQNERSHPYRNGNDRRTSFERPQRRYQNFRD